jgi:chaperone required for assembly of F1-ATPase
MKRFWREVTVVPEAGAWTVALDGKPVRTPARQVLLVPTEALAEAVGEEWRATGEEVDPSAMPVTRLATTAVDLMPARRKDAIDEAAGFAATDLLCYRAGAPADLVLRQARSWQPWLDWAERHCRAALVVTEGVISVEQPPQAIAALRAAVERLDDWRLVGLHAATTLTGSVVLGLALEAGALAVQEAFVVALLDELYEIEQWGEEERQQQRHALLRRDLAAAERYLRALEA